MRCGQGLRVLAVDHAAAAGIRHGAQAEAVAVYPLVPTRQFDDALTYLVPPGLAGVCTGALVEVPVGTAMRVGVVARLDAGRPDGVALREIVRMLDHPPVPAELVALAEWVADSYGVARTRALAMVVPPRFAAHARASALPTRQRVQAVRRVPDAEAAAAPVSSRLRAVAAQLPDSWVAVSELAKSLGTTRASLQKLADAGVAELELRPAEELRSSGPSEAGDASGGDDLAAVLQRERVAGGDARRVELTEEQLRAVDVCEQAPSHDPATLLMGITGSGKTEVYLELIERALARGRDAIVLVPEIALTPQTARRFVERFPGMVEVLHSNLTRPQRAAAYDRIVRGGARVVVGPRSAVFAPLRSVGVIVVDEEHDSSYKQESDPRYDARRVAWRRAAAARALLVLGSATPRPESWHGIARRASLRQRVGGARLAPVELVDLRQHGDSFPITEQAHAAIDATLRRGRKAIVLHNRRGYANALHCRSCGHTFRCGSCDVSLVIHGASAARQQLACHHCGYRAPVPRRCPECSAADVARMGAGTERIERDLAERFGVEVFRLDADSVRTGDGVAGILQRFADAGPAVLTGTQMVAKGHDFPDVELAVVVDSETALAIPDFRAEERAFSLVAQLAGRAGRSAHTAEHGRVLVQSWDPDAEFLQYARRHDVEGFLEAELARRRDHRYPPFSRLVRVLVSSPDDSSVEQWSRVVADGLATMQLGPVLGPAPLLRLSGRFRAQAVLKTDRPAAVARSMRGFLRKSEQQRASRDVRIVLDVDPQTMI